MNQQVSGACWSPALADNADEEDITYFKLERDLKRLRMARFSEKLIKGKLEPMLKVRRERGEKEKEEKKQTDKQTNNRTQNKQIKKQKKRNEKERGRK